MDNTRLGIKEEEIFRGMFVLGSDDFEKLRAKARTGKGRIRRTMKIG